MESCVKVKIYFQIPLIDIVLENYSNLFLLLYFTFLSVTSY